MNWIILKLIRNFSKLLGFKVIVYKSTPNSVYFDGDKDLIRKLKVDGLFTRNSLQKKNVNSNEKETWL